MMTSAKKLRAFIPVAEYRRDTGPYIPSLKILPPIEVASKPRYEGEMAERERKAQEEIAHKRTCVAPLYNKGGLQFITPETDPKTLGRK